MPANRKKPSPMLSPPARPIGTFPRSSLLALLVVVCLIAVAIVLLVRSRSSPSGASPSLSAVESQARANPQNLTDQLAYADALLKSGDHDAARHVYAYAAHLAPNDYRPYEGLGIVALQEHRNDYAQVNMEAAVRLNPKDALAWQALGGIYLDTHQKARARKAYEQAAQQEPNNANAWHALGVLDMRANLYANGLEALQRAVTLAPNDPQAQIDLANADLAQGNLPEAHAAYQKALALKPGDPSALAGDAETLLQLDPSPSGLAQAERQVHQALSLEPSAYAHLVLGRVYLQRRDYPQAVKELKQALTMDPNQYRAYNYLSQAYAAMGQGALAKQAGVQFQKAYARANNKKP